MVVETKVVCGWCAKCRANQTMKEHVEVLSKRNLVMAKGKCIKCGTNMCRIIGKPKAK